MKRHFACLAILAACAMAPARAAPQSSGADGLTVILILDVSWSVSQQSLRLDDRYVRIFNAFLLKMQPSDRGAVAVLANALRVGPLTSDPRQLTGSVRGLLQVADADRLGPTPIWDALDQAIGLLAGSVRPALILYSDGRSTANRHSLSEVVDHATRAGVIVHVIIPPQKFSVDRLDPADLLDRLASATGGRRWMELKLPGSAAALVAQVMDLLHQHVAM